jgi:hypothetical protein
MKWAVRKWLVQPGAWLLTVKVPLLVAVLMAAVGSVISYSVLTRLADDQETQLRQLSFAHLETLAVALEPHLARQDVWETFDVLDHARRGATAASIRLLVVTLPDATVVAASDPMMLPVGTPLPAKLLDSVPYGDRQAMNSLAVQPIIVP